MPGQQPLQLGLLPPLQLGQRLVVPQQGLLLPAGFLLGPPRGLHLLLQCPQLLVQFLALQLQDRLLSLGQRREWAQQEWNPGQKGSEGQGQAQGPGEKAVEEAEGWMGAAGSQRPR